MNFSWQNLKVTVAIVLTLCGAMTRAVDSRNSEKMSFCGTAGFQWVTVTATPS